MENIVKPTFRSVQSHMPNRHRSVPLYKLDEHVFWPDRKLMCEESERVRTELERYSPNESATIKIHSLGDDTPLLQQMWKGWYDLYGDLGETTVTYFYIDPGMNYTWHVDSFISTDMTSKKPVLCAMNIVVTDETVPAEFSGYGEMHYTAAVFNTSHLHKVDNQNKQRTLARITFRDAIYEEVVHRVKRVHKQLANNGN